MKPRPLFWCHATLVCLLQLDCQQNAGVAGDESSANAKPEAAGVELNQWIADLSAIEFSKRQHAISALRDVSGNQLQVISDAVKSDSNIEAVRRLLEILERRFDESELMSDEAKIASEALENAAISDRWSVAEVARDVLHRHWQRRTELAIVELSRMNVALSPKDPGDLWKTETDTDPLVFRRLDPTSKQHLKIYIDKSWPQNPQAFELLKRLDSLKSDIFLRQQPLVSIYLIDGHPLAIEQVAVLKGVFGDTGIAERGRVCLGVLNEPQFGGEGGIYIRSVQPGSCAEDAGLRQDEVITGLNGKKLSDFEQLVTQLRTFDVGDKIVLQVLSGRIAGEPIMRDVEVTLKGWY